MPSKAFMKRILEAQPEEVALADAVMEDVEEVLDEDPEVEEAEESEEVDDDLAQEEEADDEEDSDGEDTEAEEAEDDDAPEHEESDADEEPEASHEESEFYLGRYLTREEAEQGLQEKEATTTNALKRAAEAERELAYYRGLAEGVQKAPAGGEVDFDDWADNHLSENPERGMIEAIQISRETSDPSYAYAYADRWADADLPRAEYDAAIWRNRLETAVFNAQQAQPEEVEDVNPAQTVISETWTALAAENPDMREDEVIKGISEIMKSDPDLRDAAISADPAQVRLAFLAARKAYRLQAARPQNGTPRRVSKSDRERVAADKVAATVSTGDGAPAKRSSTPALSPEEQSILEGAEMMGLKLRET